jgi:zinc/manganese transport system substrate-binding protein
VSRHNPPAAIIRAPFENEKPAEWLSSRLDVPIILMPYTVGGNDDSADLVSLYDATIALLEAHR